MFQDQLPSAEEVSRTLADILSGPDFEAFAGGLLIRMLSQLWMRFRDWVRGFFPDVSDAQAEFLTVLIAVVCLGAVAFVVLRSLPQANPQSTRRDPDAVPDELRTARDWLRIAAEQAGDSEYRHAATALYQGPSSRSSAGARWTSILPRPLESMGWRQLEAASSTKGKRPTPPPSSIRSRNSPSAMRRPPRRVTAVWRRWLNGSDAQ